MKGKSSRTFTTIEAANQSKIKQKASKNRFGENGDTLPILGQSDPTNCKTCFFFLSCSKLLFISHLFFRFFLIIIYSKFESVKVSEIQRKIIELQSIYHH